jgi:NTE family protein
VSRCWDAATTSRALVLAGGGIAGIGWETGILLGIADESPLAARALLDSDVLVGTSAGSTVAAQLASGLDLETLFAGQTASSSAEIDPGAISEDTIAQFVSAVFEPGAITQKRQRIGAIAAAATTVPEDVRRTVIAQRLPSEDWPARALRLTAIDVVTGELVAFDATSGVPLVDAVAASCSVPGAWPPVTIDGRRFMDGGVGSSVNITFR